MAMWHDYVYFETPDNYLVSLEAKTGKERWHKVISDFNQQYFSTMAPIVIGNHVLAGTGNDLDAPASCSRSIRRPASCSGSSTPCRMNPGDPGLETWGSLDAARHGGAQVWIPGSYDPGHEALYLRHRQSDAGLHAKDAAKGTTSSRAR